MATRDESEKEQFEFDIIKIILKIQVGIKIIKK